MSSLCAVSTWIPAFAALLAAFAALTVPRVTFQLALRQDHIKWHRDQRAQLYVDLIVEANAESLQMEYEIACEQADGEREVGAGWYTDLRLLPAERARLGARATMFASREVLRQFNAMEGVGARRSLKLGGAETTDIHARIRMTEALGALQQAIRAEMRTDDHTMIPRRWRRK